jgi:Reverse transcriptase (RNA-dependent DNA polymerase)
MERIINNQLLNYLELNKLISKEHGFIRKRSSCTNILESMHDWCLNLQNYISTDAVYFDFKKALDSVAHPKLLIKLPAYGINGNLYTWISDFLHNRVQVVKMNYIYSHTTFPEIKRYR